MAAEKTRRGAGEHDRRAFGRRVRERREALGLRPEELADWLGITTRDVLQLEAGLSEPGAILQQRLRRILPDEELTTSPTPIADAVDEFLRKHRRPRERQSSGS